MRSSSLPALLVAAALLGAALASAATLQSSAQAHSDRRARSALLQALLPSASTGQATGAGLPNIWQPPPIKIDGAAGASNYVQLLVLLLPAPASPAQCKEPATAPIPAAPSTLHPTAPPHEHTSPAPAPPREDLTPVSTTPPAPRRIPPAERRTLTAPTFPPVENSQFLLQQFRAQVARSPSLPPVVIEPLVSNVDDEVQHVPEPAGLAAAPPPAPAPAPQPAGYHYERRDECRAACRQRAQAPPDSAAPPPPRFDRSLMLQGMLTVYNADYSEPYTVWWDAASGASRIDYHNGTASTYRTLRLDGKVQSVQVVLDRTGEADVRRCVVLAPRRVPLAERALPVLPPLAGFSFAGYMEVPAGVAGPATRVERWRQTVAEPERAGERLTYRHELLLARAPDNHTSTPLRYAVSVDSSLLGENCDSYAHRFLRVQTRTHDPTVFHLDIGDACEQIVTTDDISQIEPLREFTMLQRDKKYNTDLERYKRSYSRRYADEVEEAVRKNLLIQSSRFVSSGNRQGASFELEVNFLSDRLEVEQHRLLGAEEAADARAEPFPHSDDELRALRGRLPQSFDWRMRGAVTPVRYQGTCSSCWAFSVVGAVEGALFVNSGRLVPLSEQSLVDCGRPYGTNGCNGTWPNFAYDYVQQQGLPALDEYPPYAAEVQQCRAESAPSVTRVSGYVNVTALNIVALKVAIRRHGPTVVLVDAKASSFAKYKRGYYYDAKCRKDSSNHAMLAVGWSVHRGETYFILKNWWSTAWGEAGYMRLRASTNTCGVLRRPSYPRLRRADVLRVPAAAPAASPAR